MRMPAFMNPSMLTLILALALNACAYTLQSRVADADALAGQSGWARESLVTGAFHLAVFLPQVRHVADTVTIYIEGDGLAWLDPATPSLNPTPKNPVALQLALRHGAGAAYIARPCQYVQDDAACRDNAWWTNRRFAPEVIAATDKAVNAVKQIYKARHVVLAGYSGGGAVAALVAAQRNDVAELVTIAGNLDTDAWVKLHGVTPLSGSLNPADSWTALQDIPQRHYVGANDKTIPPSIARSYAARFPPGRRPAVIVMDGYDHACCWTADWQRLLHVP